MSICAFYTFWFSNFRFILASFTFRGAIQTSKTVFVNIKSLVLSIWTGNRLIWITRIFVFIEAKTFLTIRIAPNNFLAIFAGFAPKRASHAFRGSFIFFVALTFLESLSYCENFPILTSFFFSCIT